MRVLTVDPGDVHVGMSLWDDGEFIVCWESSHADSIGELKGLLEDLDVLVIESYQLYPWMASIQTFSKMETVQLIGRMKMLAEDASVRVVEQTASVLKIIFKTPYYRSWLKDNGKPEGPHAGSAVGHGLFFLYMNTKGPSLA